MELLRNGSLSGPNSFIDRSYLRNKIKTRRHARPNPRPARHVHPVERRRGAKHDGPTAVPSFGQCHLAQSLEIDRLHRSRQQARYDDDSLAGDRIEGSRPLPGFNKEATCNEIDAGSHENEHEEDADWIHLGSPEHRREYRHNPAQPHQAERKGKGVVPAQDQSESRLAGPKHLFGRCQFLSQVSRYFNHRLLIALSRCLCVSLPCEFDNPLLRPKFSAFIHNN